jgi:hypothetical protein
MLFVVLTNAVVVRWKNSLILGIDACFKVKLKDCGVQDPDLLSGSAYMVNEKLYQNYLSANTVVAEPVSLFYQQFYSSVLITVVYSLLPAAQTSTP